MKYNVTDAFMKKTFKRFLIRDSKFKILHIILRFVLKRATCQSHYLAFKCFLKKYVFKVLISLKSHLDITQNEIQQPLHLFNLTISSLHSIIYIYSHLNLEGHTYIYIQTQSVLIYKGNINFWIYLQQNIFDSDSKLKTRNPKQDQFY